MASLLSKVPRPSSIRRRIARRERLLRSLVHSLGIGARLRRGSGPRADGAGLLPAPEKLAEHVLQDPAVLVVKHLLRRVDPDRGPEPDDAAVLLAGLHRERPARRKSGLDGVGEPVEVEYLPAGQSQRLH